MPKCTEERIDFGRLGRRVVEADFSGGELCSDGGLMLLRQVDRHTGLTRQAGAALDDARQSSKVRHSLRSLIAQRIYALCCGYEDLNDHDALRLDSVMQTALDRDQVLASAPTLCRLENTATRAQVWALHEVLISQFIASYAQAPDRLVLDIDASDIELHGDQQLREFHGYYDHHCYLPLYVFCGDAMLACYLRRSRIDGAKNTTALIKLLVQRLRRSWPDTEIIVRADSGFCRLRLIRWCERNGVGYVIGVARNPRLQAIVALAELAMADEYAAAQRKQRMIDEFTYAAESWDKPRRIVTRLEYGAQGTNPRFVVTNLTTEATELYDSVYCQRGEAENRIKEVQLDLFGTRASCHKFLANQFRLLLAALAYTLMQRLRVVALHNSDLANASASTVRSRLLKIGVAIVRNTRRIRLMYASHHPLRELFARAALRLSALSP